MLDYYTILGVPENATQYQIKTAYRKRMKEVHPDLAGLDDAIEKKRRERLAKQINEVYITLSDPHRRRLYDLYRRADAYRPPQPGARTYRPPYPHSEPYRTQQSRATSYGRSGKPDSRLMRAFVLIGLGVLITLFSTVMSALNTSTSTGTGGISGSNGYNLPLLDSQGNCTNCGGSAAPAYDLSGNCTNCEWTNPSMSNDPLFGGGGSTTTGSGSDWWSGGSGGSTSSGSGGTGWGTTGGGGVPNPMPQVPMPGVP
jgi:hypothetical protein